MHKFAVVPCVLCALAHNARIAVTLLSCSAPLRFYPVTSRHGCPSVAPAEVAPLGAARSAAAASAAAPSVEWAVAAATAAAVAAAVKNTKTRRTAVGGMPAAVLFLGFRREGNSFDKSTLLTYTEKHA